MKILCVKALLEAHSLMAQLNCELKGTQWMSTLSVLCVLKTPYHCVHYIDAELPSSTDFQYFILKFEKNTVHSDNWEEYKILIFKCPVSLFYCLSIWETLISLSNTHFQPLEYWNVPVKVGSSVDATRGSGIWF